MAFGLNEWSEIVDNGGEMPNMDPIAREASLGRAQAIRDRMGQDAAYKLLRGAGMYAKPRTYGPPAGLSEAVSVPAAAPSLIRDPNSVASQSEWGSGSAASQSEWGKRRMSASEARAHNADLQERQFAASQQREAEMMQQRGLEWRANQQQQALQYGLSQQQLQAQQRAHLQSAVTRFRDLYSAQLGARHMNTQAASGLGATTRMQSAQMPEDEDEEADSYVQ